jgi:UDP-3-O-[3-hydroxymyristoyl] glucosamine N-acyltransferase
MPGAEIAAGCRFGAFRIIGSVARIAAETEIGSHCEVGVEAGTLPSAPLYIAEHSVIRSGSIFYQSSTFGPGLMTGHRVTVREGTIAGDGLQIGTANDILAHAAGLPLSRGHNGLVHPQSAGLAYIEHS